MSRLKRRRMGSASQSMPEVTLTPLIDTALTLLIIFMVATPMMNNMIKIELPATKTNEAQEVIQEEMVIFIDKHEKMYLNNKQMNMNELLKALKEFGKKHDQSVVFVKGDKAVSYGHIIHVVDTIKIAGGIKHVALATQRAL